MQGFPFFHGAMRLKRTITVQSTNWQLRCAGRVQYMRVFVNGQKAGTLLLAIRLIFRRICIRVKMCWNWS